MTTLLVMTTGQTDVQLVLDNERHKLDGNACGTLHDAIVARPWCVVDAPATRSREIIRVLPEGELTLCTPKLDAVLAHLGVAAPTSALLFETTRQGSRDPRHSGQLLERRLRDRGITQVTRVSFLTGAEQLEDPSCALDAVVRRDVVAILSKAIRGQVSGLVVDDQVFVATTGGLSAANDVIGELVRLHCVGGPTVTSLEVPDGDRAQQNDRAVEEAFHPSSGLRARWHALSLVEKGNLLGAWGAVSHLENAPGQAWTRVIKWLALFASSLPLPEDCDLVALRHTRMAVRAGLRVELALRSGDIPRAVHGTVAFFEAALWDRLSERLQRSTDPKRQRCFRVMSGPAPTGDKLLRSGDKDDDRTRPFELKETLGGVDWYWVHDGDGGPAARLTKYFLQSDSLMAFDKALGGGAGSVRELRNDIAHNEPTPALMDDARRRMENARLWSAKNSFLRQPLVQVVMTELGEEAPESLFQSLLVEVRRRLVSTDMV